MNENQELLLLGFHLGDSYFEQTEQGIQIRHQVLVGRLDPEGEQLMDTDGNLLWDTIPGDLETVEAFKVRLGI